MLEPDAGPTRMSGSKRGVGQQWPTPTRLISLSQNAPEAFEATMNSLGYEYQSDFARRYVAQGKAEGQMEGRVELTLQLLALRFGQLPDATQARVRSAQDAQLDAVIERMLTAQTLQEA